MNKYPSTLYHPCSPSKGKRADRIHPNPGYFLHTDIAITEKLDGSNTLIHQGKVYNRSVAAPSTAKWNAMVKKHHTWKITDPNLYVYGENLFGVHSIEYNPMREEETFRVFAILEDNTFLSWYDVRAWCAHHHMIPVPYLYAGTFGNDGRIDKIMSKPEGESDIGPTREGFVMRVSESFPVSSFNYSVCKSVRPNHVQTNEHWTRNWKPCKLLKGD